MNRAQELAEMLDNVAKTALQDTAQLNHGWAHHFRVKPNSADLLIGLAAVQRKADLLLDDIESSSASERAKGLFQGALKALRPTYTAPAVYTSTLSSLKKLSPQVDILFMAAEVLPQFPVPQINKLTLEQLSEEISNIIDSVKEMDLDQNFRSAILSALSTLLMAIRQYEFLGPEIAATVYGAAAAALAQLDQSAKKSDRPTRSAISKALGVCKKAGAAVIFAGAVVGGAHTAITDGRELFGLSSSDSSEQDAADTDKGSS